ncbi:MAG TPA: peptidylprolyl isomerase, partial [Rhizomicrobium sp.]|nr:peptidylprolyl isomerase [Rhizomicrobium sp.]
MRIATTLLLGAAILAGVGIAGMAEGASLTSLPAVPPLKSDAPHAAIAPAQLASAPTKSSAPAVAPRAAASNAPPTADPAAEQQAVSEGDKPPTAAQAESQGAVQEANNNSTGLIDATATKQADNADSIVATVNDETISDFELRQRVALYLALNGITQQLTPEQKTRIRNQILEVLEAEKLQLQEAQKKKITVSPLEVDKRINGMTQDNRFTVEQLRQNLKAAGASEDALRAQLTASIAWQKAVQDEYADRVNVTPEMINAEMARNAESANRPHYRVLEIFLPVDNPELDPKVKKDAEEVENQLHQGAPFSMVARQFSQHPSAATGGDMGWINEGQLAPELNTALAKLELGAISEPIRSTGGYYIIALRERQEPLGTKIETVPSGPTGPAGTLPLARLLFPVDPHGPKEAIEQVIKVAVQIQTHYAGCSQLDELHQGAPFSMVARQFSQHPSAATGGDMGWINEGQLAPELNTALAKLELGAISEPIRSTGGYYIIALRERQE